jgi:D-alanyl-D-alanine carboxypeptidase/D-alanyl-D-alanine-endopeptidase (penicillin-binding protein 4)
VAGNKMSNVIKVKQMKKSFKKTLIPLIINAFIVFPALSQTAEHPAGIENKAGVRQTLDDYLYLNNDLKNAFIGVKIRDLITKEDIYSLNADKLFTPASNIKIYTTLLALEKLGKDYVFKTTVSTDGSIQNLSGNKVVNGNLYFNFAGDPTFTRANLSELVEKLKESGIKEIKGDIIINRSLFDETYYGPGWMWDDMDSCDSSPINPVFIDDNCVKVNVSVTPEKKLKIDTTSTVNINTDAVEIVDQSSEDLKVKNFSNDSPLTISGKIGQNETSELEQSIYQPENYFIYLVKPMLKNIKFNGKIKVSSIPPAKSATLAQNISKPVKEILKRFDKESHNLTGELLLKTVGLKEDGKQGSTKKGAEAMKKFLENTFHINNFNIVDGSGLSRYNLVSPELTMDLLEYIYNDKTLRDIVFAAFPVGGAEGTLKNRLKNISNYKVIAKSGSMTGVNCLSGYLAGTNGKVYSFSIMINNANIPGKALRDIQDHILEVIAGSNSQ